MRSKGDTWNESQTHTDEVTGRRVRRITTDGLYNQKPPYHPNTTFTDDGEFLIFATYRDGRSALCRAHVPTGEITVLIDPIPDEPDAPAESRGLKVSPGTLAPKAGWGVYWRTHSLRAVHVHTLEERTLIENIGEGRRGALLSVDPTETTVVSPTSSVLPRVPSGKSAVEHYKECFPDGKGLETRFVQVPLAGGDVTEVLREEGIRCAHCEHCPTDGDLLLIDRDLPPMYWCGGDYSRSPRSHVLHLSTGRLTPLVPTAEAKFQIHAVWSWDGQYVLYHGPVKLVKGPCPWYIGAVAPDGQIHREWTFEDGKNYGHVASAPDRPAIILDGNVTSDCLTWLYYDGDDPRLESICRHGTEWGSLPGQLTHPHPSTDRGGRWVAFNVARDGRTDVWVVAV